MLYRRTGLHNGGQVLAALLQLTHLRELLPAGFTPCCPDRINSPINSSYGTLDFSSSIEGAAANLVGLHKTS